MRVYRLSSEGRRTAASFTGRWSALAERAGERVTVGASLDRFAAAFGARRATVDPARQQEIEAILAHAGEQIARIVDQGER